MLEIPPLTEIEVVRLAWAAMLEAVALKDNEPAQPWSEI
jgi:hypothetical protein